MSAAALPTMEKIINTSSGWIFSDHVVMAVFVKSYSEVKNYVWVPHLVDYFYFFNEVYYTFLWDTFSTESFYCNCCSHPFCFKYFTISTPTYIISFVVEFEISKFNVEGKSVILESLDEIIVRVLVQLVRFLTYRLVFTHTAGALVLWDPCSLLFFAGASTLRSFRSFFSVVFLEKNADQIFGHFNFFPIFSDILLYL